MGVKVEAKAKRMPAKTLKALKDSIKHWEENVRAISPGHASTSGDDCALCEKFAILYQCWDCPVRLESGQSGCAGTPFEAAVEALENWEASRNRNTEKAWRRAAEKQLKFLKSLLPATP